jgi:hypothetical protein
MQATLKNLFLSFLGALVLCFASLSGAASGEQGAERRAAAEIRVEALGSEEPWRVTWRLRKPAGQIVFPRSTDDNRVRSWLAEACCEIVRVGENEIARRRDGREFKEISLRVPPVYAALPKDYAPFSPFGDGGMLFHSGRFFACGESCPDDPRWSMRLSVPKGRHILLNGERKLRRATWEESGGGRSVYIGESVPVQTPDLIAVIDKALPETIRVQLSDELPKFMSYFAGKLGALETPPMLFASYHTASPHGGSGQQGGVLPGQVFIHFYGSGWPERMKNPNFGNDLAWHFAHEAAHLYQRRNFDSADAWIHEGSAEVFAAIALRERGAASAAFVEARIERARKNCAGKVAGKSIRDVLAAADFDVAYSCGLVLGLAVDEAIRASPGGADGLFAVWKDLAASKSSSALDKEDDFLAAVARVSSPSIADAIRKAVRTPDAELSPASLSR